MKSILFAVAFFMAGHADALTACAYRCDQNWAGLDTGVCYDGDDCPSPDSDYVATSLCSGLPFQPGPGDILLHDAVPFDSTDACDAYLASWRSTGELGNLTARLTASGSDKTPYPTRGQIWSTTMGILEKCVGVDECRNLVKGLTGKEVQDCFNKCAFEYGEAQLEKLACDAALAVQTGGLAYYFCNYAFGFIMQPINNFLNKYLEEPVVDLAETVEDAVASAGRKVAHFFHFFGLAEGETVVV
jgi:hypothetical protein